MTRADAQARRPAPRRGASLRRLPDCIRLDEVCVLQGAPLLGACHAMQDITAPALWTLATLLAGNLCLVAHVFVFNDWAGIAGDLRDPNRRERTFIAKGIGRAEMGGLALALLTLALLVFGMVGATPFVIAAAIAGLSALYSAPGVQGKGTPVFSSILHLAGGTLHFLLGHSAFAPVSGPGLAMACYFGIVFAAGHLTHEARDHDGDLLNGIRTNAVAFGRLRTVLASLGLFTLAYALLAALALSGIVPAVLGSAVLLYPLHLRATLRALRGGLDFGALARLQACYRRIHAVIGLAMLVTVPPWW